MHCLGLLALTWTLTRFSARTVEGVRNIRVSTLRLSVNSEGGGGGYPQWPESAITGRRELSSVLHSFMEVAVAVPIEAASEADSNWEEWLDGGFAAHKFIHKSISRQSYPEVLSCLHVVLTRCQEAYPDLWAVLRFVPKKNGLNRALARLASEGTDAVSVAELKPHALRRRLDDLQRSFEQSWALISCYLSQPQIVREDMLWSARTLTEKVKTDHRSKALELLCVGIFGRGAALFPLIVANARSAAPRPALCSEAYEDEVCVPTYAEDEEDSPLQNVDVSSAVNSVVSSAGVAPDFVPTTYAAYLDWKESRAAASPAAASLAAATREHSPAATPAYWEDGGMHWLREDFARQYSGSDQQAKAGSGKRGWERSRLAFPFLELAHRTWLNASASGHAGGNVGGSVYGGGAGGMCSSCPASSSTATTSTAASSTATTGSLLASITRSEPDGKVLNSLVYWLVDLLYKEMRAERSFPRWAPEPYLLRVPGVEARMVDELSRIGHLVDILATASAPAPTTAPAPSTSASAAGAGAPLRGAGLLRAVRETETTVTLLSSMRSSCEGRELERPGEGTPRVVERYTRLVSTPGGLGLYGLQALQYEALAELLDLEFEFVATRHASIASAFGEWRQPELLFRYLGDSRHDAEMAALIKRWLRSIFGLSDETLRQIRRESPQNVRHLQRLPRAALIRWYAEACPGTSSMHVLFMMGEDAGSCLRIVGKDGNTYNRALLGYVLQSHVRALVVRDANGDLLARSIVRLLLRSDTLTPIIFCDPIFFHKRDTPELRSSLLAQAKALESHMRVPVVHAGSVLPVLEGGSVGGGSVGGGGGGGRSGFPYCGGAYVRRVQALDYDIRWVELLEMDGVAPYTYSEELPYDDLLQQHTPGVQARSEEAPALVIATLPRADSPSAGRYVAERRGETAWTMEEAADGGVEALPEADCVAQQRMYEHVSHPFNPAKARKRDLCATELLRNAGGRRIEKFQASLLAWLVRGQVD